MTAKPDKGSFERLVREAFGFLEENGVAPFRNCRLDDDDPRDACIGCTFENDAARISIAYSWLDLGAGVSIYLRRDELPRHARSVYLEPWIEFQSEGRTRPLVPPFYPASSRFKPIMDERKHAFEMLQLSGIMGQLATKLREHIESVVKATEQEVLRYQDWFQRHP